MIEEVDTILNTHVLSPPSDFANLTHSLGRSEVFISFSGPYYRFHIFHTLCIPVSG